VPTAYNQAKTSVQKSAPSLKLTANFSHFNGVNNNDDVSSISDNQSVDTLNTVLDSVGAIMPRQGYTKLLTTKLGGPITGGAAFYKSDGTSQLVYGSGQYLYKYNNAGGSTAINTSLFNPTTPWSFDVYGDVLYGVDGNELISYNGSTNAAVVSTSGIFTTPTVCRVHKNRLWVAQGSNVYFSDSNNPTSLPVVNVFEVNTNDGQSIVAMEELLDSLVVFKTDSIWLIKGEPLGAGSNTTLGNLNLQQINSSVGAVSMRSVVGVDSVIYFMGRAGLYMFENNQIKLLSQAVNGTFRNDMNPNALSNAWGIYSAWQKKYILGYTSNASSTPDKALCYDLLLNDFTVWDHLPGGWAINFRFNQLDSVVMGDPNQGNIYELFQGYADIAGYNSTLTSATSTTLVDSAATWTTNQFVDCRVQIGLGTGAVITGTVTANSATTLTCTGFSSTPVANTTYTIGGYDAHWISKIYDFDNPAMTKRYRYLRLFLDAESDYSLQVGAARDFSEISYNLPPVSLFSGTTLWDQTGVTWDEVGIYYDTKASLYNQTGLPGQGRFIQLMFGNFNANEPWRCFEYAITYQNKTERPY
jgi:hypothetical protein